MARALTQFTFQRGEPIVMGFRVESGTVLAGHSSRMRMKAADKYNREIMPGDNVLTVTPEFAVSFTPAAGQDPAYWLHTLTPTQSLEIDAGEYLLDASLLLDGEVVSTTNPVLVVILEAASAQA